MQWEGFFLENRIAEIYSNVLRRWNNICKQGENTAQ